MFFLVMATGLSACASYTAKLVDPIQTEATFRQRSLRNPQMRAYLAANAAPEASTHQESLGLTTLTLIALFYNPDIEAARERVRGYA